MEPSHGRLHGDDPADAPALFLCPAHLHPGHHPHRLKRLIPAPVASPLTDRRWIASGSGKNGGLLTRRPPLPLRASAWPHLAAIDSLQRKATDATEDQPDFIRLWRPGCPGQPDDLPLLAPGDLLRRLL